MNGKLPLILVAMAFSGASVAAGTPYGTAAAPQWTQAERELFQTIDRDGDGHITKDELLAWFEEHDRRGDDRLSLAEFAAFVSPIDVVALEPMPQVRADPHEFRGAVPLREPAGPEVAAPRDW